MIAVLRQAVVVALEPDAPQPDWSGPRAGGSVQVSTGNFCPDVVPPGQVRADVGHSVAMRVMGQMGGTGQLSVLGPGASRVPTGVVPSAAGFDALAGARIGDRVMVGSGEMVFESPQPLTLVLAREWSSRVTPVAVGPAAITLLEAMTSAAPAALPTELCADFAADLLAVSDLLAGSERCDSPETGAGRPPATPTHGAWAPNRPPADRLAATVRRLVGLGPGLTPSGDDLLAGALAGLHAAAGQLAAGRTAEPHPAGAIDVVAQAIRPLLPRTNSISAQLLRLAIGGHACTELNAVLRGAASATAAAPSSNGFTWTGQLPTGPAWQGPAENAASGNRLARNGLTCLGTDRATPFAMPAAAVDRLGLAVTVLLRVGHTSGADLAAGLCIGLAVADRRAAQGRAGGR